MNLDTHRAKHSSCPLAAGPMLANVVYLLAAREGSNLVVKLASQYPASRVLLVRVTLGERHNRLQASGVGCPLAATCDGRDGDQ